ncbi:MAG: hypothetical protein IJJ13_10605 [Lachnospiraceae bacterium]|nr:hypothetical protein [Lachnospiraceae bacterium]
MSQFPENEQQIIKLNESVYQPQNVIQMDDNASVGGNSFLDDLIRRDQEEEQKAQERKSAGKAPGREQKKSDVPEQEGDEFAHYKENMIVLSEEDKKKDLEEAKKREAERKRQAEADPGLQHYRDNMLKPNKRYRGKNNPVKKAVEEVPVIIPLQVPAEITHDDINDTVQSFFYIKQYAYRGRRHGKMATGDYDFNARWSSLSLNQKIKRTRKAEAKKGYRDTAKTFAAQRAEEQLELHGVDALPEMDPNEQEINAFLGIGLEQFRFNNDQEFTRNLQANYALTDQAEKMERFLERVVEGKAQLPAERVTEINKKITLLKEVKEWMDARLDLIQDPYYVLLSSKELNDSTEMLEGIRYAEKNMPAKHREHRGRIHTAKLFLEKVERVKNCAFSRTRFRDQQTGAEYRAEFAEASAERSEEKSKDYARRRLRREEKQTRDGWQASARQIMSAKKTVTNLEKKAPATMEEFDQKRADFMKIDLAAFHFNGIPELLTHHAEHDALFAQAREMHRILSDVVLDEQNMIPEETIIPIRARLALFDSLRKRQAKTFAELTSKDSQMDQLTLEEWIKVHDLVLVIDPKTEEERILREYRTHQEQSEELIRKMYGQLKPGQELEESTVVQAKDHYQKNQVFWESMKYAKAELDAQDLETKAYADNFFDRKHMNAQTLPKNVLIYLRGKSKEETEAILERYAGNPEQEMGLLKEIADHALQDFKPEEFRLNTGNPGIFAQNFVSKLHQSDMMAVASDAVKRIEELAQENPQVKLPEGYDEEYKKELGALTEFAKDHIVTRMNVLTGTADETTEYLGTMSVQELTYLKADRKGIRADLAKPVQQGQEKEKAAATAFFEAADKLIKNKLEIGDLKYKDKQKVASTDDGVDAVYQTYRLAWGIKGKADEFSQDKRIIYDQILQISENPLFSSREELQSLRDRCIAALSDYEPEVAEYLYYDLSTAALKDLAMRKLRENMSAKDIMEVIRRQNAAGIRREKEQIQPEWGEKEKDAIDLLGDLAAEKQEDAEGLFALLQNHAEILTDMALVSLKDPSKEIKNRKRYRVLKQKLQSAEYLPGMLKEEETSLKELQAALEKSEKSLEKLEGKDKQKEENYLAYLKSQIRMHEKEKASIEKRLEEVTQNKADYKKELDSLSYLEPREKEIEDKEAALAKSRQELEELEEKAWDDRLYGKADPTDVQLKQKFNALEDYEKNRRASQNKYDEESKKEAPDQAKLEALQKEIDGYDFVLEDIGKDILALEAAKKEKKNRQQQLKERIAAQEEELEKLKADPKIPLDVFGMMGRKMEGPESVLAKEIGAALNPVVQYLAKEAGEKGMKLRNIREILRKKDPVLMELLAKANGEIRASMKQAYADITAKVKDVTKYMFEDLNNPGETFLSEAVIFENGETAKREAYYRHQYSKEDKERDQAEIERIRQETNEALKDKNADVDAIMRQQKDQLSHVGPEALCQKQAQAVFTKITLRPEQKEPVTLETLFHKNWYPDENSKDLPGEGAFVRNVMQNYFDKASEADKKSMMSTLMRSLKPKVHDKTHTKTNSLKQAGMYLAGLLRGAGPLCQKMMQGVPEKYLMEELSLAVEDMKSKLTPIPDSYVKEQFQKMIDQSGDEITEIKKLQSLGAASVGQTFLCRVYGKHFPDGKQMVIKILRPDAKERIDREEQIMKDCARETSPGMLATYEGQLTKIREELDLRKEAENCQGGVTAYEGEKGSLPGACKTIHVMEEIPPTEGYLVLDKAEGDTVDRYINQVKRERWQLRKPFYVVNRDEFTGEIHAVGDRMLLTSKNITKLPETRAKLVKELTRMEKRKAHLDKVTELWITESLFGEGFYHGDMHAGNLMVNEDQATILDYGNATKLSKDQVKGIIGISGAAMYGDARTFLDHFLTLLPEQQLKHLNGEDLEDPEAAFEQMKRFTIQKNELRHKLHNIFKLGDLTNGGEKLNLALTELQKYGFQIPISVYSYVQSQTRLANTLDDVNKQIAGLRWDIHTLDTIRTDKATYGQVDFLMVAQEEGKQSQNQEAYYNGLLQATEETKEADFVSLLMDREKGEDGTTAFEKKYMSMYDRLNLLMSGKATYVDDIMSDEEETLATPVPKIDTKAWRKEYEELMQLKPAHDAAVAEFEEQVKRKERENDRRALRNDPRYQDFDEKKTALATKLGAVFQLPSGSSNGLLEGFGSHWEFNGIVNDFLEGDRNAFEGFVALFENSILPAIQLAKDLRTFIDKGGTKTKAKELFQQFRKIQDVMANKNQTVFEIRKRISMDRLGNSHKKEDAEDVAKTGIQEYDTTQFRELLPQWQTLDAKKNEGKLTPEETAQYDQLGKDLVNSRHAGEDIHAMRERIPKWQEQLSTWFMDKDHGSQLYSTYQAFSELREKDMQLRDKNWADRSLLAEREKAENAFLAVYRKISHKRLVAHMKAYQYKVPEEKEAKGFDDIFEGVVKSGMNIFGMTGNMMKLSGAIGMLKAKKYNDGLFVAGLDLDDTIPQKIGDVPQPIILKEPVAEVEEEEINTSSKNKNEIIE